MPSYTQIVGRADSAFLQRQVGDDAVRVVRALDPRNERSGLIREIFLGLFNPYEALCDSRIRNELIDLLRPNEAQMFADALQLTGDPYEVLKGHGFSKGSKSFKLCCSFFGLSEQGEEVVEEEPTTREVAARYGLFPHQQRAVLSLCSTLTKGKCRAVLHMPTGAGKTRMAMHVVCRFLNLATPCAVIWLANSEELCDQAADEFLSAWSFLGNRTVELARFWGQHELSGPVIKDGLIIGGFPKLYALATRSPGKVAALGDHAGLLVIDEAHQAIAPTYELIIQGLAARKVDMSVLGLTATPGRTWNDPEADRKLADFFDRKKITLNVPGYESPVDFLVQQGFLARPNFRPITYDSRALTPFDLAQLEAELDIPMSVLRKLAADELRTTRIVREIEGLCERHKRIIVFATTVSHARLIAAVLTVRTIAARCITSETSKADRAESIAWYKASGDNVRIIVNFGVLTTGFDAPLTSAAVIARPTKSLVLYSQMVGRAIRGPKAGGNKHAEIVTVVDTALPGFGDLAQAFNNWEDVW
jgi:DNA repair protein RadD